MLCAEPTIGSAKMSSGSFIMSGVGGITVAIPGATLDQCGDAGGALDAGVDERAMLRTGSYSYHEFVADEHCRFLHPGYAVIIRPVWDWRKAGD